MDPPPAPMDSTATMGVRKNGELISWEVLAQPLRDGSIVTVKSTTTALFKEDSTHTAHEDFIIEELPEDVFHILPRSVVRHPPRGVEIDCLHHVDQVDADLSTWLT